MRDVRVVEVTEQQDDDVVLDGLLRVRLAVDAELAPEDPPIGRRELRLRQFQYPERRTKRTWLAWLDGEAAGMLTLDLPNAANRNHVQPVALVHPDARRSGVATSLVRAALTAASPARDFIGVWVEPGPAVGWCERLGLTFRQPVRRSRLTVAEVDREQQRTWIDDAPGRQAGYRVVSWRGPYPEDLMDQVCTAFNAMADAPQDDVEHEDPEVTPALVRDGDRSVRGLIDQFGSLALSPDGEAAGITELGVTIDRPTMAEQGDTAVVAAHRGFRLGRWLKAVNLARALDAHPGLASVDTFNSESNPWMLDINVAMGFRPHRTFSCYQGSLPRALEVLERSAARA